MVIKLAYNNDCENLFYDLTKALPENVSLEAYNESLYKERKKAFKIKGGFSARATPFAVLYNDENKAIKAFYSEDSSCTLDNILNSI